MTLVMLGIGLLLPDFSFADFDTFVGSSCVIRVSISLSSDRA